MLFRSQIKLADWRNYIDSFMAFNEQPLLRSAGTVSHDQMKQMAHDCYETFDQRRRSAEAQDADVQELRALEQLEKRLSASKKSR